jgi:DNA modification methylase
MPRYVPDIEMPTDENPCVTLHGDAIDVMRRLPDEYVDAVITDPPYGISFQSGQRVVSKKFDHIKNDDQPYIWWLRDAASLLKSGGCLLCFCRWDTAEAFRLAIRWAGLKVTAQLVWDRVVHGMGDLTGAPSPQHDLVWFAAKGRYQLPGRRPTTVYRAQRSGTNNLVHPNEKPVDLFRRLVRDYVPENGLVLDPFSGSGATLMACRMESRRCIAIDLDPSYARLSQARLNGVRVDGNKSVVPIRPGRKLS